MRSAIASETCEDWEMKSKWSKRGSELVAQKGGNTASMCGVCRRGGGVE